MNEEKLLDYFGKIDDKYIEETEASKSKISSFPRHQKFVAIAACFALVLSLSLFNNNKNGNTIFINEIVAEFPSNSLEYIDPATHTEQNMTIKETATYFGKDYSKIQFPFNLNFVKPINTQQVILTHKENGIVSDTAHFGYESDHGYIQISASKISKFTGDSFELENTKANESRINGVDCLLYHSEMMGIFHAYFEIGGTFYETSSNLEETIFIEIIETFINYAT